MADYKVSIIMLGESDVGKTSLMLRYCKNIFRDAEEDLRSASFITKYIKTIVLQDRTIDVHVFDTAGQERYRALVKHYFRKADGVLLVFDITKFISFCQLSTWLIELRELNQEAEVLIVGNKSDLRHLRAVSKTLIEKFAQDEGLDFFETSARTNENVDEAMENLVSKVLERRGNLPINEVLRERERVNRLTGREVSGNMISVAIQTDDILLPVFRLENFAGEKIEQNNYCCKQS